MTTLEPIEKMEKMLIQAILASDVAVLDALLADELVFTAHTGQHVSKTADLEAHRLGKIRMESITCHEQVIQTYGQTALVSVLMAMRGVFFDEPFEGKIRYTRVWVNVDNAWQIVAAHSSLLAG